MAFVTRTFVVNFLRKNEIPYWKIVDEGGYTVGENKTVSDTEESINELEENLDNLSGGWVTISAKKRKSSEVKESPGDLKSGFFKWKVSLGSQQRESSSGGQKKNGNGSGMAFRLLNDNFTLKLEIERMKIEKTFEEKFGSGKKDSSDMFLEKIGRIMELEYLKSNGNSTAAISEVAGTTEPKKTVAEDVIPGETKKEKVLRAIGELASVDENVSDNLLKLANFAKSNPALYKEYVKQL